VDKLKEPDGKSPALIHGARVHAIAAAWITRTLPDFTAWDGKDLLPFKAELEKVVKMKQVPLELERFTEEVTRLRKLKARCEEMWCLDRQWRLIEGAGWSPHVWLRVKVDCHIISKDGCVEIYDWKTGKFNPEHAEQRSLYAIGGLVFYPDARRVTVVHGYLDQGIEKGSVWEAKDLEKLKAEWAKKTTAMLQDSSFVPTPSPNSCRWCSFKRSLGGPCTANT
jgi:hypothetical protein